MSQGLIYLKRNFESETTGYKELLPFTNANKKGVIVEKALSCRVASLCQNLCSQTLWLYTHIFILVIWLYIICKISQCSQFSMAGSFVIAIFRARFSWPVFFPITDNSRVVKSELNSLNIKWLRLLLYLVNAAFLVLSFFSCLFRSREACVHFIRTYFYKLYKNE